MRVSSLSIVALAAAHGVVAADNITVMWKKLTYALGLMEANLNYDRARVDNFYTQAALNGVDGNPLDGTEKSVADVLIGRLLLANELQIVALNDLRGYLYWPEDDPETYYGTDHRTVRSIDFHVPEGFLDTQGVFDDKDGSRPFTDIPDCTVCPPNW